MEQLLSHIVSTVNSPYVTALGNAWQIYTILAALIGLSISFFARTRSFLRDTRGRTVARYALYALMLLLGVVYGRFLSSISITLPFIFLITNVFFLSHIPHFLSYHRQKPFPWFLILQQLVGWSLITNLATLVMYLIFAHKNALIPAVLLQAMITEIFASATKDYWKSRAITNGNKYVEVESRMLYEAGRRKRF